MINEKRFYKALEDIFVGAKVEGDSGFVNLLKIKEKYYSVILERFKKEVEECKDISNGFREEFFDKLYNFFEKYFSESGSVYFVKTANWQRVYEKVYTDNRDVVLFWKTHMLYYVKSDILFNNLDVLIEDKEQNKSYNFYFDVGNLKLKQNNEKKKIIYKYREKINKEYKDEKGSNKKKNIFIFDVIYSSSNRSTNINDIVKKSNLSDVILNKAFNTFEKQSEVDFFINKNAKAFLTEQLDLYLHQILLSEENKFEQDRLNQLKLIKEYAIKIIDFISQFEDELVRIWNKPKIALNSNYVISIDKLNQDIIDKIFKHPNYETQYNEWVELGIISDDFDFYNKIDKYSCLPIDTKYFKDLEAEILGIFDHIDAALDGRLIHSENYQALNTLKEKYNGTIQCIYIDPPFNTGSDFNYVDKYKNSTWITIMSDRINLGKGLLKNTGKFYLHLDYRANHLGKILMDQIFGEEKLFNEIIWRFGWISGYKSTADMFIRNHQTILAYDKDQKFFNKEKAYVQYETIPFKLYKKEFNEFIDKLNLGDRNINLENTKLSFKGDKIYKFEKNRKEKISQNYPMESIWNGNEYDHDLNSIMIQSFVREKTNQSQELTQKPEHLLKRIIETSSNKYDTVLDFFSGSGTTIVTAHKLQRKWIGIEMGEHVHSTILPRLKEALNALSDREPCGISKDINWTGGGFFKYYSLEQYEDTLRNMKYKDNQISIFDDKKPFEEYIFFADNKLADVLEIEKDNIELNFNRLYKNIDWAETISNLLGLPIKRIFEKSFILENGDDEIKINVDFDNMSKKEKLEFIRLIRPLLWWGE